MEFRRIQLKRKPDIPYSNVFVLVFFITFVAFVVLHINQKHETVPQVQESTPLSYEAEYQQETSIETQIVPDNIVEHESRELIGEVELSNTEEHGDVAGQSPTAEHEESVNVNVDQMDAESFANVSDIENINSTIDDPENVLTQDADIVTADTEATETDIVVATGDAEASSFEIETETIDEPVIEQEDSDTETYDTDEMAAFHAIKHNNMSVLQSYNVTNLVVTNEMGYNVFHYAAHRLNIEAMEALFRYNFNLDKNSKVNGKTALHIIVERGEKYTEKAVLAVTFLLNRGVDGDIPDNDGYRPIFLAVNNSNIDLLRAFMNYPQADIYVDAISPSPLLHVAMKHCKRPIIKAILDHNRFPSCTDPNNLNRLAIHEAAALNCVDGLKELILTRRMRKETKSPFLFEGHCRVEDTSECLFGATPLHHAAKYNSFEAADFLASIGSDLNRIDSRGNRPYDYAPQESMLREYLYEREQWEREPYTGNYSFNFRYLN